MHHNLNPLTPWGYPRNMHLKLLVQACLGLCEHMQHGQKTLRFSKFGGWPDHISSGVFMPTTDEGHLLIKWATVSTASAQNSLEQLAFDNMHLTLSITVLSILSASPFRWGVPLTVLCLTIPFSLQNWSNSSEQNSRPLSVLNLLIFLPDWVSTKAFHSLNFSKESFLFFRM